MPLWTLSTHLFFTWAMVLLLLIKHCHEILQCWVFVLMKAVWERLYHHKVCMPASLPFFCFSCLFVNYWALELHPHKAKPEPARELEHLPDEHVVWRHGAQELIKHHIW